MYVFKRGIFVVSITLFLFSSILAFPNSLLAQSKPYHLKASRQTVNRNDTGTILTGFFEFSSLEERFLEDDDDEEEFNFEMHLGYRLQRISSEKFFGPVIGLTLWL